MLESTPDGIGLVDPTGRIVLTNSQSEKLFSYDRAELRGKLFQVLLKVRLDQPPEFPGHSGAEGCNGGRLIPGGYE